MERTASIRRTTKETDVRLTLNLDGTGKNVIHTGIGFFDHMLNGFARHGQAILKAVGDKAGIRRYGHFILPMDETLVLCAVDLSGRPYLKFDSAFTAERLGGLDTEMVKDFFYAVSYSAMMNIHLRVLDGDNNHHMAEALFKSFGKALDMAVQKEPRIEEAWTTKGSL